jgi:hypothetical protein
LAVLAFTGPDASAQKPPASTSNFAVLAGTAVTCTDSTITGDVGVFPGSAVTRTGCRISGTVHRADAAAEQAYLEFVSTYNDLRDDPPTCDAILTGTLAGQVLMPGVYCVAATAKTGTLTLDAGGDPNAAWTFLVDGALTGTNFNVVTINGGDACNVTWWVRDATTLTTSNFLGTVLAGAAITVTGGSFSGDAFAKAAVTLTGASLVGCDGNARPGGGHPHRKCNQGIGNGPENCDPGNSNHHNSSNDERENCDSRNSNRHNSSNDERENCGPRNSNHHDSSNDERGGTPGNPGRKGAKK